MGKCAFRLLRLVLFLLALTGIGLSTYLMYLHYGTAEAGLAKKLCTGGFDCATVLQSRWGNVELGEFPIPVSMIGTAYFIVLAVWLATVGRLPGWLHHACLGPALLATLGAVESGYLIYVMGWRLHAWCGFCLAVHAVNALMLLGLWTQWLAGCRARSKEELAAMPVGQLWKVPVLAMANAMLVGITLLALFGLGGTYLLYHNARWEVAKVQQDQEYQRWKFGNTAPAEQLVLREDDPALGPANAPHTVVMFGDFQCAHCAQTDRILRQVQEKLDNRFRLVFKHFPLNRACNAAMDEGKAGHAFGCLAAEAAEAARRLGGNEAFWKMHDALYENQRKLDEKPYTRLAQELGLDAAAFENLLADAATRRRIEQDAAVGKAVGVQGTPAVFLDRRRVDLDVINDPSKQEPDIAATVKHWTGLLAAAEKAAATQPAPGQAAAEQAASAAGQPIVAAD